MLVLTMLLGLLVLFNIPSLSGIFSIVLSLFTEAFEFATVLAMFAFVVAFVLCVAAAAVALASTLEFEFEFAFCFEFAVLTGLARTRGDSGGGFKTPLHVELLLPRWE